MAYLPPDLRRAPPRGDRRPDPGRRFRLAPVAGGRRSRGVGELVYAGPNVMLGYAEHAGRPRPRRRAVAALRTGDLARQADDGLWEVVGRLSRCAKLFGLRLDLDRLERLLAAAAAGPRASWSRGDRLWAFVDRPAIRRARHAGPAGGYADCRPRRSAWCGSTGAPRHTVRQARPSALAAHVDRLVADEDAGPRPGHARGDPRPSTPCCWAGRTRASTTASSRSVATRSPTSRPPRGWGGRSGTLPAGWQRLEPVALASTRQRRRRFTVPVDLSVVLRALAMVLILVSHADLAQLQGGAHILLGVAGYNLARFQLGVPGGATGCGPSCGPACWWRCPPRCGSGRSSWSPVAIVRRPRCSSTASPGATAGPTTGSSGSSRRWSGATSVWRPSSRSRAVDRWQRRRPFAVALAVLAGCLALRYSIVGVEAGPTERYSMVVVLWCLALGWAAGAARTPGRRSARGCGGRGVDDRLLQRPSARGRRGGRDPAPPPRPARSRCPGRFAAVAQVVATASLWIYLTQWQVYPELEDAGHPYAAVLASLAVGILVQQAYDRLSPTALGRWRRRPSRRTAGTSTLGRAPSPRAAGG